MSEEHFNSLTVTEGPHGWLRRTGGRFRFAPALLGIGLAGSLGVSCASIHSKSAVYQTPDPVWPSPPEPPRIAFVQSITRPSDIGVKPSAFQRLGNWITGGHKGNERFSKPFGVALDENDNLCLTDTGANAVGYLDFTRKKCRYWTGVNGVSFVSPVAVAKDKGMFFVADSGLGAVIAFTEQGKLKFKITGDLQRPAGLAIGGDRLFVADSQRHCVEVFDLQGKWLQRFGQRGAGPGEFDFPTHLAADRSGHLFVTDSANSRVEVFDWEGRFENQIGSAGDASGNFSRPKGVAVDNSGHVYVVDANFDNIQIFDLSGQLLLNLGEAGSDRGQFWLPNGVAISRDNRIFVTDCYNQRVQILKYIGQP